MNEVHYPWMDNPIPPEPKEIKKCQVKRFPGCTYKDPGPFRRCGCDQCKVALKAIENRSLND